MILYLSYTGGSEHIKFLLDKLPNTMPEIGRICALMKKRKTYNKKENI